MLADLDGDVCMRHRQAAKALLYCYTQRLGRFAARYSDPLGSHPLCIECRRPFHVEFGSALVVRFEFTQPVLGLRVVLHDCGQVITVFATQVSEELAPLTHHVKASR